jgi:hypothetical protein
VIREWRAWLVVAVVAAAGLLLTAASPKGGASVITKAVHVGGTDTCAGSTVGDCGLVSGVVTVEVTCASGIPVNGSIQSMTMDPEWQTAVAAEPMFRTGSAATVMQPEITNTETVAAVNGSLPRLVGTNTWQMRVSYERPWIGQPGSQGFNFTIYGATINLFAICVP